MTGAISGADANITRLTDELRRIADRISNAVPPRHGDTIGAEEGDEALDYPALAEALLAARRRIGRHFPSALFADPARDILLDLYVSSARGKPIFVSSACIAASVPATTALRWIKKLRAEGLVELAADTVDNRRVLISLSDAAAMLMEAYLADVTLLLRPAA